MSTTTRATITTPNDTDIVITREFNAPANLVFHAMTTPELVKRWWGPGAYENHIAEIDLRVGGRWRFGQRMTDGSEIIFGGEYREIDAPARLVYTEAWLNMPAEFGEVEDGLITATYEESGGRTVVTAVCTYSSKDVRDGIIASGMESGLQETYDRLDDVLSTLD